MPTTIIIGTGFSGIAMAHALQQAGVDFLMLERSGEIGGVWRDNVYPGVACDVPAHLYSLSFAPNPGWSRLYAPGPEIQAYLRRVVDDLDLHPHIRLHSEVTEARFEDDGWTVALADGTTLRCTFLVGAVGALKDPSWPAIPHLRDFEGTLTHSSGWDTSCDLTGKQVGVIGTGASAIQIIPAIADQVADLHVFQRTPAWVSPRRDRPYREAEKAVFARSPLRLLAYRLKLYLTLEARFPLLFGRRRWAARTVEAGLRRRIHRYIDDPAKAAALTPDYAAGCKRILVADDYYPAMNRDDVHLHTAPIERATATGLRLGDGSEVRLDALVCATGFTVHDPLGGLRVVGKDGTELADVWGQAPTAYLGLAMPRFPNLFLLLGPNTGLGHNSVVIMAEAQARWTAMVIRRALQEPRPLVEVTPTAMARFVRWVRRTLPNLVWGTGCDAWYTNDAGVNFTIWPGSTLRYLWTLRRVRWRDLHWG